MWMATLDSKLFGKRPSYQIKWLIFCTNGTFGQDQEPSSLKCQDELQNVTGLSAFFTV